MLVFEAFQWITCSAPLLRQRSSNNVPTCVQAYTADTAQNSSNRDLFKFSWFFTRIISKSVILHLNTEGRLNSSIVKKEQHLDRVFITDLQILIEELAAEGNIPVRWCGMCHWLPLSIEAKYYWTRDRTGTLRKSSILFLWCFYLPG